jgi:hypothetical protein
VNGYARLEVKLEAGKTAEVNLPELEYEVPGTVTIRCRGRGDPANLIDPWWSGVHGHGAQLFALVDLAARPGNLPGGVEIGEPDEVFREGRLEFAYIARQLPPGRYKAIPWEGAAEKDCRVFEVFAGRHTEVVIQGG